MGLARCQARIMREVRADERGVVRRLVACCGRGLGATRREAMLVPGDGAGQPGRRPASLDCLEGDGPILDRCRKQEGLRRRITLFAALGHGRPDSIEPTLESMFVWGLGGRRSAPVLGDWRAKALSAAGHTAGRSLQSMQARLSSRAMDILVGGREESRARSA
jgi:hypothetical protein